MADTIAEVGGCVIYLALVGILWGIGYAARRVLDMRRKHTMRRKLIVIAETKEEGLAKYPTASVVVTPRSPDGARGMTGAKVIVMGSMRNHEKIDELLAVCAPATMQILTGHPGQTETVTRTGSKGISA